MCEIPLERRHGVSRLKLGSSGLSFGYVWRVTKDADSDWIGWSATRRRARRSCARLTVALESPPDAGGGGSASAFRAYGPLADSAK